MGGAGRAARMLWPCARSVVPLSKGLGAANLAQPYDFSFTEEAETHGSSTHAVSSRQLDSHVESGHRIINVALL